MADWHNGFWPDDDGDEAPTPEMLNWYERNSFGCLCAVVLALAVALCWVVGA